MVLSGPMFRREFNAASRRGGPFASRTFVAFVLGCLALASALIAYAAGSRFRAGERTVMAGRVAFAATLSGELLLLIFLVPTVVGESIARERQQDTLPSLLLTRLTPLEIVLTKAGARWLGTLSPVLVGLPFLAAWACAGGLETLLAPALLGMASSAAFMAALAILASAQHEQPATARALALAAVFSWLIGPPILSVMGVRTSTIWGIAFAELRPFFALLASSSPVSLATDRLWLNGPVAWGLADRVAWMAGLQAVFGMLAVGLASAHVKAGEPDPSWNDPTRGYRPRCGDDPIFWREYELPVRRGGGSLLAMRLRYVLILLKAIVFNVLALAGSLLSLALPIGILLATAYCASGALREYWQYGQAPSAPFARRYEFHWFVRIATFLGYFPILNMGTAVSAGISSERDRKTWDIFLSTPLDGGDFVRSKARVAVHCLRHTLLPFLPVVWGLGLACGVVTLPGLALAAIILLLAAWLSVSLGLYAALRPLDPRASAGLALVSIVMMAGHLSTLLVAALASPRELATPARWNPWVFVSPAILAVSVTVLTALAARRLTRRTIEQFDEWVGRPVARPRPSDPAARASSTPAPLPEPAPAQ